MTRVICILVLFERLQERRWMPIENIIRIRSLREQRWCNSGGVILDRTAAAAAAAGPCSIHWLMPLINHTTTRLAGGICCWARSKLGLRQLTSDLPPCDGSALNALLSPQSVSARLPRQASFFLWPIAGSAPCRVFSPTIRCSWFTIAMFHSSLMCTRLNDNLNSALYNNS